MTNCHRRIRVELKYLVCISCRSGRLEYEQSASKIVCRDCNVEYQVINGVPCFVPDELMEFSEVDLQDRDAFLAMKSIAYSGSGIVSRLYNHYHLYAAQRREEYGRAGLTVDIGFGIGEHYPRISETEKAEASFIGIDIDRFKLEHFNAAHPEIPVLQASAFILPIADNCVDVVQLLAILEHFEPADIDRVLDESLRVLKPEGLLIVSYPAEGGLLLRLCQHLMHAFIRLKTGFDLETEKIHHHPSTAFQVRNTLQGRQELRRRESYYYPFGWRNINLSLFLNETYVKLRQEVQADS